MKTRKVSIEIRSDRMEVILLRGRTPLGARRVHLDLPGEPDKWLRALRAHGDNLTRMIEALGAVGARATVFHVSPSLSVDVVGLKARSGADAMHAARLTCLEGASYPIDVAVGDALILSRDKSEDQKRQLLAAVERDDVAATIAEVVQAAGLRLASINPLAAPIMKAAIRESLASSGSAIGVLYVGEHTSCFAVSQRGTLLFARPVRVGLDTLIKGLCARELTAAGSTDAVTLSSEHAARLLMRCGIPGYQDVVDEELGLTGAQVMPLIQPALQRLVVELRQSLRFGMRGEDRDGLSMKLSGPGGRLAGLAGLLETELEVVVDRTTGKLDFDHQAPGSPASDHMMAICSAESDTALCLLPVVVSRQRRVSLVRRWAWAGVAASLAMIGFDAFRTNEEVQQARQTVAGLEIEVGMNESLAETRDRLLQFRAAMATLDVTVAQEMHGSTIFAPLVREVGLLTPRSVRLQSLELRRNAGQPSGTMVGLAIDGQDVDGDTVMSMYLKELRNSPLIERVVIRTVQKMQSNDMTGKRFEFDLSFVSWASDSLASAAGVRDSEGTP